MNYKNQVSKIYKEYCKERGIKFSEKDLKNFLEFLEIDFYDWVRENLKQYFMDKKNNYGKINSKIKTN